MEDLPEALREIIKRLPSTSDLNSLSLVSKRLYTVEAELRDAIYVGCGVCPVTVDLASLCSRSWFSGMLQEADVPQVESITTNSFSWSALRLMSCENVRSLEWLEYLGKSGSLEELVVGNCERIRQFDLLRFGSGFMKVQKFEFQNSNFLKDLTLARISTESEIGLCCLLRKCKALGNLSLYYVLGVHDTDMITMAQSNRNLRSISLMLAPQYCEGYDYRTTLTDDSLKALALWCPMLQSVELTFFGCEPDWPDEIGFTQEGLVMLIRSCPIRDLKLGGANIFDDEGMKALSRARFIEALKLINCVAITDAGMHFLARSPSLINLTLELCDGLTDDGVVEVVRARKLSLTIAKCCQISLKAVQGAAKTVHYTDDCPGYKEWMDRCVCGPQV
ncbi:hypothetical protein C2845_PM10G13720 [Panicum miliaceum]|uniref:F-box domain-containing protein n=1 Tax=Panicum miliaceum TaxID=4540 RepID=A0A3L6PDV0_PANMI|nr:hypothetical protein C2845_PM10G13720 [Panicum miliaceum]